MSLSSTTRRALILGLVVVLSIVVALGIARVLTSEPPEAVPLSEALELIDGGRITAAVVNDSGRQADFRIVGGTVVRTSHPEGFGVELSQRLTEAGADVNVENGTGVEWTSFVGIGLLLLLFPALVVVSRRTNVNTRSLTMTAGPVADVPDSRFADVAGCEEAVGDLAEVVDFLHKPERFAAAGARMPRGFLLVGPPGTGKTLLARAVAGEAGVPFFAISGSDFVETFVGVGAARVRSLFAKARKHGRAIVFIDEIDAVGKARGGGPATGSSDEREATLNQLLVEMDGFASSGVVVLAATNRADVLDRALLRPGRFDRRITVPAPDRAARLKILQVHAEGKSFADGVDLNALAQRTPGLTGADLAQVLNEAALEAARHDRETIASVDVEQALATTVLGRERRSAVVTTRDRQITAWHEAGHAVAALMLERAEDPVQVSIVPRGETGGVTWMIGRDDNFVTRTEAEARIVVALAGRAAEEQLLDGDVTQGAASDLIAATRIATDMVTRFGMSELGTVAVDPYLVAGAEASEIHAAVRRILDRAATEAGELLARHRDVVEALAERLLVEETIDAAGLTSLLDEIQVRRSNVGIS